jgi:hypothetical protein
VVNGAAQRPVGRGRPDAERRRAEGERIYESSASACTKSCRYVRADRTGSQGVPSGDPRLPGLPGLRRQRAGRRRAPLPRLPPPLACPPRRPRRLGPHQGGGRRRPEGAGAPRPPRHPVRAVAPPAPHLWGDAASRRRRTPSTGIVAVLGVPWCWGNERPRKASSVNVRPQSRPADFSRRPAGIVSTCASRLHTSPLHRNHAITAPTTANTVRRMSQNVRVDTAKCSTATTYEPYSGPQ